MWSLILFLSELRQFFVHWRYCPLFKDDRDLAPQYQKREWRSSEWTEDKILNIIGKFQQKITSHSAGVTSTFLNPTPLFTTHIHYLPYQIKQLKSSYSLANLGLFVEIPLKSITNISLSRRSNSKPAPGPSKKKLYFEHIYIFRINRPITYKNPLCSTDRNLRYKISFCDLKLQIGFRE